MISGVVGRDRFALVELAVKSGSGQAKNIKTIVDTGFNGALTLPLNMIAELGLPWRSRGSAILANGEEDEFDIHAATVIWDGAPRRILVEAAATEPLIGMRLLDGHELRIQVRSGGSVTIEALR
jgi:clan AA aspartic protease